MKTFTLCADDYSLRPTISEGILNVLKARRLTAVSCVVTVLNWVNDGGKAALY